MVKRLNFLFLATSCLLLLHVAQCAKPTTTPAPAKNGTVMTTAKPATSTTKKPAKKGAAKTSTTTTTSTVTPLEDDEEEQAETIPTESEDIEEELEATTPSSSKKAGKKNDGKQKSQSSNKTAAASPAVPLDMYSEFYHLQVEKTKQLPPADDTSAKLTEVYVPVTLYDKPYQDVYIDNNGLITLGASIAQYQALQFPLPYAAIAPLYQDVDTRGEGFVRYQVVSKRDQLAQVQLQQQLEQQRQQYGGRISSSNRESVTAVEDPLERAAETIHHFFPRSAQNFEPEQVIIAQWEEVGYYQERTDKLNTYQTVIVSDNADSYVIFLYGQLEWDAADSKLGQPRMPGQAGFVGDRGYAYIIKEYGKPLQKLARGTNVGRPGMYVFHIGRLSQTANGRNGNGQIQGPEIATNSPDQDFTAYPSESRYGASPYGGSMDGARELQQFDQQQQRRQQQQQQQQNGAGTYPAYDEYYGEQVDEYERRQREEADRRRQQQPQQPPSQPIADPYEQQRREYYAEQARARERTGSNPSPPQQPGIYPIGQQQQQTDQYGRQIPSYYAGENGAGNDEHLRDNGNRYSDNVDHNRLEAEARQLYDPRYEQQQQHELHRQRAGPSDGTCTSQDKSKCDSKAGVCDSGCCRCQDGLKGNGVVCINPSEALRMHGTFSGTLGGEPINTATIFTHAMLNEGRIYGALGDVDPAVGAQLTALLPTVATLGWLSAAGGATSPNGFDIAGLEFVSNMQLKFSTGEAASVRTTFNGHADHDRDVVARVDIVFDGQLPDESVYGSNNSSQPLQLSSDDLQISYLKTSPGAYKAEWTMPLRVDESTNGYASPVNVSVTETITYRECPQLREEDAPTEVHVLLERPYGLWQNDSKASRFSVTARLNDADSQRHLAASRQQQQPHHHEQQQHSQPSYTPHYREGFYGQSAPIENGEQQPPYAVGGYDPYYEAAQRERQHQQEEEERRRLEGNIAASSEQHPDYHNREHVTHSENGNGNGNGNGGGQAALVPNESATNPCERLPMPESATCAVQDGQARYDCVPGLRVAEWLPYGEAAYKPKCEDVNECLYGQDNCAEEAECVNTVGSFMCKCKPGYAGDGKTCMPGTAGAVPAAGSNEEGGTAVVIVPPVSQQQQPGLYPNVPYQPQPSAIAAECARLQCAAEATCVINPEYSKPECRCNPGYRGDGYVCMPDNPQTANCNENRGMCDPNAECNADGRCSCREGFAGDGTICIDANEQCNIQNNCHPNAKCTYNQQDGSYLCKCSPGYTGDGYQCQSDNQPAAVDPKDCSRYPKICDANAQCILDRTENAYRCRCYPGYIGPGITCSRAPMSETGDNCYLNPQMCHSNAACRPTSTGTYACKCLGNYFGDGVRSCSPAPRGGFIVYTQGQALMRKYVDANAIDPGEEIVSLRGQTAIGIAVDCQQSYVYWSDIRTNTIQRINYKDKSNKSTVFDKDIGSPEGMVIDPVSRNIFWTDSQKDQIVVANIDHPDLGSKVIAKGNLTNPRGIAILPQRGYVFWTDWNRQEPKIERADMDGSNRRVLFDKNSAIGLQLPNAIAVCAVTERIYWADAGTHKIMSADLEGQDGQVVYDQARYPFSMALLDNTLYWSDWDKNKILFVSKTGGEATELDRPLTASGRAYGIAAVPDVCPNSLNSRCADSSTLCRFICVPLPQGRDECICPDGVNPAECQQSAPASYYQR